MSSEKQTYSLLHTITLLFITGNLQLNDVPMNTLSSLRTRLKQPVTPASVTTPTGCLFWRSRPETVLLTWFCIDDHLLPRMRRWVVTVVGHVLAGPKLQDFHKVKRDTPLQQKLLVMRGMAVAIPTALRTSGESRQEEVSETHSCVRNIKYSVSSVLQGHKATYIVAWDRIVNNNLQSQDRSS